MCAFHHNVSSAGLMSGWALQWCWLQTPTYALPLFAKQASSKSSVQQFYR